MLVSTKGRYALRLMVCVARAGAEGKVALREVSEREDISLCLLYTSSCCRLPLQQLLQRAPGELGALDARGHAGDGCQLGGLVEVGAFLVGERAALDQVEVCLLYTSRCV